MKTFPVFLIASFRFVLVKKYVTPTGHSGHINIKKRRAHTHSAYVCTSVVLQSAPRPLPSLCLTARVAAETTSVNSVSHSFVILLRAVPEEGVLRACNKVHSARAIKIALKIFLRLTIFRVYTFYLRCRIKILCVCVCARARTFFAKQASCDKSRFPKVAMYVSPVACARLRISRSHDANTHWPRFQSAQYPQPLKVQI